MSTNRKTLNLKGGGGVEEYTRRENLRFNNILETENEDCRNVIYRLIDEDLEIRTHTTSDSTLSTAQERKSQVKQDRLLPDFSAERTGNGFGMLKI